MEEAKIVNLYDLNETIAKDLISKYEYPWEVLPHISDYILEIGPTLPEDEYKEIAENVWVHKTATIDKSATIKGPTIIGSDTEVRPGAYIRGKVIIGNECVIISFGLPFPRGRPEIIFRAVARKTNFCSVLHDAHARQAFGLQS